MLAYKSQTCVSAFYLLAFVRQNEIFGDYPLILLKKQKSARLKGRDVFNDDKRISYAVVDDYFWVRVRKPQELRSRLFFRFYFFGYKDNVPYNKMPNICVRTRKDKVAVEELNLKKNLGPQGTSAQLKGEHFILKVPLKLLGDPDFILTCVMTDKTFLPLDAAGFRRVKILEGLGRIEEEITRDLSLSN
jgi:hypothetical protein